MLLLVLALLLASPSSLARIPPTQRAATDDVNTYSYDGWANLSRVDASRHQLLGSSGKPRQGPLQALPANSATSGFAAETESGLASAARTCSVNSFTAGTLVLLADVHQIPISKVKPGMKVVATDPATSTTAARRVDQVIVHGGKHTMVDLTFADGSKITATDRHPFWDASTGQFTYAIDLHAGEQVREANGSLLTISKTRSYTADLTAYNLTIDGINTYYAGITPVLVHNSCGGMWSPGKPGNPVRNAFEHYVEHGAEFESPNALSYVRSAQNFLRHPAEGTLTGVRSSGDVVRYNPATEEFGVMTQHGAPRTYFIPDPAEHGLPTNCDYFMSQF